MGASGNREAAYMSSRRQFIAQAVALGSTLGLETSSAAPIQRPTRPLRVLILGGTGFIGPYFVRAAVARGYSVSVFNRGRSHAALPPSVERLVGDRDGNLQAIANRDWDAVIDDATYGPVWVRSLGAAIGTRTKHYTFISTVSVYDTSVAGRSIDETSAVLAYRGKEDPYSVTALGPDYGALKVLCEREAERQFPGRTLVLRLGYVIDPAHQDEAVTYWPVRAAHGGKMMAAGDPSSPVQFIDVRDMADWVTRMVQKGLVGTYNTTGPASPMSLDQLIEQARRTVHGAAASPVSWVPETWLADRNAEEIWNVLLFWRGVSSVMRVHSERALSAGLLTRSVNAIDADVLRVYRQEPAERRAQIVTSYRKNADGTGWEPNPVAWSTYLEREKEMLNAWRKEQAEAQPRR
jgi:2'-hydroxyisoflavone reductase